MNKIKNIFLMSCLAAGISNAGTVPCNGFKIEFKNRINQNIMIDGINFTGAQVTTNGTGVIDSNRKQVFTVNQSVEGGVMVGEFSFHTLTEPNREGKIYFSLTNKNLICEVDNFSQQGSLNISKQRVLGGTVFRIR